MTVVLIIITHNILLNKSTLIVIKKYVYPFLFENNDLFIYQVPIFTLHIDFMSVIPLFAVQVNIRPNWYFVLNLSLILKYISRSQLTLVLCCLTLYNNLHQRRNWTVSYGTDWHTAIGPSIRMLDIFDYKCPIWQKGYVIRAKIHNKCVLFPAEFSDWWVSIYRTVQMFLVT